MVPRGIWGVRPGGMINVTFYYRHIRHVIIEPDPET